MNHEKTAEQLQSLTARLKRVAVFAELDDASLALLADKAAPLRCSPGEAICREGEIGDRMFVIETGELSVLKSSEGRELVEVAVLGPGEIAGELCVFGPTTRSATLRARAPVEGWVLPRSVFEELLATHSGLARTLLGSVSRHLRRETSVVARLLSRDLDRRLRVAFFDSKPYTETSFRLRNRFNYGLQFLKSRLSDETVSLAAGFPAVCVFVNDTVDAGVVEELEELGVELIALRCAGYNNVDLNACERHRISVVRVPAYSPHAVAEHTIALILALNRRIPRACNRVRESNFSLDGLVGFDLHGKTAGVVGTGKIGKCVLQVLAGFGCNLLAFDTFRDAEFAARLGVRYVELDDLFANSDLITLHAPLTPQTRHMINEATIRTMKSGVMLINTSRGALIDTRALVAGLKSGHIGYAGLDVYEEESGYFFEDHSDRVLTDDILARLTTFNNVIVTSHQAFLTHEALHNIADITFENLREFESGKRFRELTNGVAAP